MCTTTTCCPTSMLVRYGTAACALARSVSFQSGNASYSKPLGVTFTGTASKAPRAQKAIAQAVPSAAQVDAWYCRAS